MHQLVENTPAQWQTVITDLTAKQHAAREHIEQLRASKRDLALEAAMGGADAKKRLDKANNELARLTLESDDWDSAILQAQAKMADARAEEVARQEVARHAQMSALTASVLGHAEEFTVSLRKASAAASAMKAVVRDMLARADPQERQQIDQIFSPGHWLRAAQNAGLREHIEIPPYTGLAQDVVPIETIAAIHLGKWIEKENEE